MVSAGTITIGGRDVPRRRPPSATSAWCSVYAAVPAYERARERRRMGRRWRRPAAKARRTRKCAWSARWPSRSRIALRDPAASAARRGGARTGLEPQVLLFDEPLSTSTPSCAGRVREEIRELQAEPRAHRGVRGRTTSRRRSRSTTGSSSLSKARNARSAPRASSTRRRRDRFVDRFIGDQYLSRPSSGTYRGSRAPLRLGIRSSSSTRHREPER